MHAAAPGHGSVSKDLRLVPGRQEVELNLGPEHIVRGRLVDLKGQPVVGASVRVTSLSPWWLSWWPLPHSLSIWAPTTSNDKGLFLIRGLGSKRIGLQIEGATITPQRSEVDTMRADSAGKLTISLAPAKRVHGRVVFADTRQARVGRDRHRRGGAHQRLPLARDADRRGRQLLDASPSSPTRSISWAMTSPISSTCSHRRDARYTVAKVAVPASSAAVQEVEVELRRGVLVRGRVTEAGSGQPVAGARVQYNDRGGNHPVGVIEPSRLNTAISGPDGRFELPVPPEPGHLLVLGPTPDYVPVETSEGELADGKPAPIASTPTRSSPWRLAAKVASAHSTSACAGASPCGVGSSGQTTRVPDRSSCSRRRTGSAATSFPTGRPPRRASTVGSSCPDATRIGPTRRTCSIPPAAWGRRSSSPRQNATEPVNVHLLPCGSARARLFDADGKPLAKYRPQFTLPPHGGAPQRVLHGRRTITRWRPTRST